MAGDRIVFSLEAQEQEKSALDEERERHRVRAERFGTEYRDPAALPKFSQDARRERFRREGFATGIDLFSEEEAAKRAARARKFGIPEDAPAAGAAAYGPDPEESRRAARAAKFGVKYEQPTPEALLHKADLFEPPRQAPGDVPRREGAVYLYGVDLMSSADVLSFFGEYGPSLVEWINDSSCCVVFEDAASARRAIAGCGHPLAPEEAHAAPDSMDSRMQGGLDPLVAIPMLWHKGRDFVKRDAKGKEIKVPLMYRMATDLDQKDPHAEKRSRYLWQGKRRRQDDQQQQQQQGRQRRQQQQQQQGGYDEGGWDEEAGGGAGGEEGGGGDDDEEMRPARRQRGGRRERRRKERRQPGDGDAEMQDAELEGGAPAAPDAAAEGEGDVQGLRERLKQRSAARRAAEEDLPFEEVPQPDEPEG